MTREETIICLQGLLDNPLINKGSYLAQALEIAIKALEQVPTDDATLRDIFCMGCEYKEQEPKTGHWSHDGSHWKNRFICSECGYKLFDEPTNYCPNCGAKMIEPQESEDNIDKHIKEYTE